MKPPPSTMRSSATPIPTGKARTPMKNSLTATMSPASASGPSTAPDISTAPASPMPPPATKKPLSPAGNAALTAEPASEAAYFSLVQLVNRNVPVDLFLRGEVSLFAQAFLPATYAFEHLLDESPQDARAGEAWLGIARAQMGLQQWTASRFAIEQVLENHPGLRLFRRRLAGARPAGLRRGRARRRPPHLPHLRPPIPRRSPRPPSPLAQRALLPRSRRAPCRRRSRPLRRGRRRSARARQRLPRQQPRRRWTGARRHRRLRARPLHTGRQHLQASSHPLSQRPARLRHLLVGPRPPCPGRNRRRPLPLAGTRRPRA